MRIYLQKLRYIFHWNGFIEKIGMLLDIGYRKTSIHSYESAASHILKFSLDISLGLPSISSSSLDAYGELLYERDD